MIDDERVRINYGWEEDGRNPMCCMRDCISEAGIGDPTTGEWWCFDCFDLIWERQEAVLLYPSLRETLPALTDRAIR